MMRLSACSIVYVIAWWFRSSRALFVSARDMKEQIGAENTFVENFPEWLKKILSSLFLALMIVFFYSITCSTASPYTCHHSKIISHIHSAFHVILRFSSLLFLVWISKRNSRIFYVFLFTAPLLKSWKMKMNTSFLHRVFQSFFFCDSQKKFCLNPKLKHEKNECEPDECATICRSMSKPMAIFWITHMLNLNLMEINTIKS